MLAENDSFNTLTHVLVPEHRLLSPTEAEEVLKKLGIARDKLPKIKTTDAAVRILAAIHGEIEPGNIIEVIRDSKTAGTFVVYRLVTE